MASFVDAAAAGSSSEEEVARSSSEEEEAGFLDDSALAVTPSAHRRLDWARVRGLGGSGNPAQGVEDRAIRFKAALRRA